MERITVTASRTYDILIGTGLLKDTGSFVSDIHAPCRVCVVAGSNVTPLYADTVLESLRAQGFSPVLFTFPAGEQSKCMETYSRLMNFLAGHRLSRTDLLIALGGGVTGDLTGFAAATYLRGIEFVQIPTTLLSAVDSSVGGKTAIDLPAGKNLVGAFWQPSLVLCDTDTLRTLPEEDFRAGCAEVIKYGILGSEPFFAELEQLPAAAQIAHVISVCVSMKRDIVMGDEFDHGARKLLNLGHSIGHAVENRSNFGLSHGFSVAIGTAAIARAAAALGYCPQADCDRIVRLLQAYGLPTESPYSAEELLGLMLNDKKVSGSTIDLIVPERVGSCRICRVPSSELRSWLNAGGIQS